MKKTTTSTVLFALINLMTFHVSAQDVNIPDANFKAYLVGNTAINTNSDTEIQVIEATAFTGDIYANNLGIADLTGIEVFTALNGLNVRDNSLASIDISANTSLTFIDCKNNGLSALDISNNTALGGIECSVNNIATLDVTNNPALTAIICHDNNLTSLDLSNCALLSNFTCDNNDLSSLDVTNCSALSYFACNFNSLTSLDLSNCTALSYFLCSGNDLTSLDLSNNIALATMFCAQNDISLLDLGSNSSLVYLNCTDNDLSILNVANGNNVNVSTFNAIGNPNLTCIQVDDDAWSTTNWTNIDATASFSMDCNYGLGLTEEDASQNLNIYPNPANNQLYIDTDKKIESVIIVDPTGKNIEVPRANHSIDVSNLRSGIYFLQIKTNGGTFSKMFVKK
jgi:hypothetical protein